MESPSTSRSTLLYGSSSGVKPFVPAKIGHKTDKSPLVETRDIEFEQFLESMTPQRSLVSGDDDLGKLTPRRVSYDEPHTRQQHDGANDAHMPPRRTGRGGGGTFQVRVGPVLTQHMRGWGGTFHRLCWGRVNTSNRYVVRVVCCVVLFSFCVTLCCVVLCHSLFCFGFFSCVILCSILVFYFVVLCCVVLCCVVLCCVVLCCIVLCCVVLCCVVLCCVVLFCVVLCCVVLCCVVLCCVVLFCVMLCCVVLCCVVLCCVVLCCVVLCCVVLCCVVLCCVVLCCVVLCCVVLCCVVLCCVVLCCVVLCCVVLCCVVLFCVMLCCVVLCCVVLCYVVLCSMHHQQWCEEMLSHACVAWCIQFPVCVMPLGSCLRFANQSGSIHHQQWCEEMLSHACLAWCIQFPVCVMPLGSCNIVSSSGSGALLMPFHVDNFWASAASGAYFLNIPLATRPDGGPVWSCGENYHFLAKDWVKGF